MNITEELQIIPGIILLSDCQMIPKPQHFSLNYSTVSSGKLLSGGNTNPKACGL